MAHHDEIASLTANALTDAGSGLDVRTVTFRPHEGGTFTLSAQVREIESMREWADDDDAVQYVELLLRKKDTDDELTGSRLPEVGKDKFTLDGVTYGVGRVRPVTTGMVRVRGEYRKTNRHAAERLR